MQGVSKFVSNIGESDVASILFKEITDQVYANIQIPMEMKRLENTKEKYDYTTKRCFFKIVSNEIYNTKIRNLGFNDMVVDKSTGNRGGELLIQQMFGQDYGFPKGLESSKIIYIDPDQMYNIRAEITLLFLYYNEQWSFLYYTAQCVLSFVDVSPEMGIYVKYPLSNKPTRFDLFQIVHDYYVDRQNLKGMYTLFKDKYDVSDKSAYIWKDDDKNAPRVINGVVVARQESEIDGRTYSLINNGIIIMRAKILLKREVLYVVHSFDVDFLPHSDVGLYHNKVYMDTIYRVFNCEEFVVNKPSLVKRKDLDYLLNDKTKWVYYNEFPTLKDLVEKEHKFRKLVISVPPEAVRFVHLDPKLDEKIRKDNGIVDQLVKLQSNWVQFWNNLYMTSKSLFSKIKAVWSFLKSYLTEDVAIGVAFEYFKWNGTTLIDWDAIESKKIGTYVMTAVQGLPEHKNILYYPPVHTIYEDEFNITIKGDYSTEISNLEEDIRILHYYGDTSIQSIKRIPIYSGIYTHVGSTFGTDDLVILVTQSNELVKKLSAGVQFLFKYNYNLVDRLDVCTLTDDHTTSYSAFGGEIRVYITEEVQVIMTRFTVSNSTISTRPLYKHIDIQRIEVLDLVYEIHINWDVQTNLDVMDQIQKTLLIDWSAYKVIEFYDTYKEQTLPNTYVLQKNILPYNGAIELVAYLSGGLKYKVIIQPIKEIIPFSVRWESDQYGKLIGSMDNRLDVYRICPIKINHIKLLERKDKIQFGTVPVKELDKYYKLHEKIMDQYRKVINAIYQTSKTDLARYKNIIKGLLVTLFKYQEEFNVGLAWYNGAYNNVGQINSLIQSIQ